MSKLFVVTVCLIQLALASSIAQQQSQSNQNRKDWWYNFPSAPIQFERLNSDGSNITLKRLVTESRAINGFRLGCVSFADGTVDIKKKFDVKRAKIKPGFDYFADTHIFNGPRRECADIQATLTVIEVDFEGGGIWMAAHTAGWWPTLSM